MSVVMTVKEGVFPGLPMSAPSLPDSIYFIDESINPETTLFGLVRVPQVDGWLTADAAWTRFLAELAGNRHLGFQPGAALHAVDLVAGRGGLLHHTPGIAPTKLQRTEAAGVVRRGLQALADEPDIGVSALCSRRASREATYVALVELLNERHAAAGSTCQVVMDGNGTEKLLKAAHRQLPPARRHVVGDPMLVPARLIPLLQAADFVAHAAFQSVVRHPRREFMWGWFREAFPQADALVDLGRLR
ncbi:hypothetical protein [Kitasatospora sp. NPDC057223]|uniref:hypothetical protein n=1 Tax=Kitasatospora sp. NPDC057223 TaxID=3346055 RepID=UPI0036290117